MKLSIGIPNRFQFKCGHLTVLRFDIQKRKCSIFIFRRIFLGSLKKLEKTKTINTLDGIFLGLQLDQKRFQSVHKSKRKVWP